MPHAKSVTRTPLSIFTATFSFFISDKKWAEISPEDQKLIRSVSGEEFARRVGGMFDASNQKGIKVEESTIEVHNASDAFYAELQEAAKPFVGKWIKRMDGMGIDGSAMLNTYVENVIALSK